MPPTEGFVRLGLKPAWTGHLKSGQVGGRRAPASLPSAPLAGMLAERCLGHLGPGDWPREPRQTWTRAPGRLHALCQLAARVCRRRAVGLVRPLSPDERR